MFLRVNRSHQRRNVPRTTRPKYMWTKQYRALSACDANLAAWCIVGTLATQLAVSVQQETPYNPSPDVFICRQQLAAVSSSKQQLAVVSSS